MAGLLGLDEAIGKSERQDLRKAGKHSYTRYLPSDWRQSTVAYLLGTSLLTVRAEEIQLWARFVSEAKSTDAPRPVHLVSIGRVGKEACRRSLTASPRRNHNQSPLK